MDSLSYQIIWWIGAGEAQDLQSGHGLWELPLISHLFQWRGPATGLQTYEFKEPHGVKVLIAGDKSTRRGHTA